MTGKIWIEESIGTLDTTKFCYLSDVERNFVSKERIRKAIEELEDILGADVWIITEWKDSLLKEV